MRKLSINSRTRISKYLPMILKKIKVKIFLEKNFATISGNEFEEYSAEKIIQAIDFGFEPEDALLLTNDLYAIEYINIKEHTHRKNLAEIRSRLIGTQGKAKRAIETLTGGYIVIHNNVVGIISDSAHLAFAIQGIISLIQGAKHSNVFSYIEKQNSNLRKIDEEDLGLKPQKK